MKLKWSFLVICLSFLVILTSGKKESSLVPYAINEIIEEHFAKQQASHPGNVDIIRIGNESREISKIIDGLFKLKSQTTSIVIKNDKFNLTESAIVFFDSVTKFRENAALVKWAFNKEKRFHHLVYVPGLTTKDILETILDGFQIDHVSFLMNQSKKSIELVSGFMFTQLACKKLQLKTINRFDLDTSKWNYLTFYPKKYENFHGCELHAAKGETELQSLVSQIFEGVLNAQIIHEVKTTWECMTCDLTCEEYPFVGPSQNLLSNPHDSYVKTFALGSGEPYTDFERMFMMFDDETWIAIAIILTIGLLVTLGLNFISDKVRNFVVGRGVSNPTVNLVAIFLTGGQVRSPQGNFARFIFILFVVWSLLIRTCHQSMFFQYLQADLRKPIIKTLDELFESNMTLYSADTIDLDDTYFWERLNMSSTR